MEKRNEIALYKKEYYQKNVDEIKLKNKLYYENNKMKYHYIKKSIIFFIKTFIKK